MHNNFYFLRQLAADLKQQLVGYTVATCFSQEKDELIIGLTNGSQEFYIKAMLTPQFSALAFPPEFNRARANSVSLFPEIIGKTVLAVVQYENERAFSFTLNDNLSLLFKLFGNRSNIIVYQGDEAVTIFQKKFAPDLNLRLSQLHRPLLVTKETFLANRAALSKLFPTFGDIPVKYLEQQRYAEADAETQWELVQEVLALLQNPSYYIIKVNDRIRLSLLPAGDIQQTFTEPVTALQEFVRQYLTQVSFEQKYRQAQQYLAKKLSGSRTYQEEIEYKILELECDTSLSQTADIIMANLTNIPPNSSHAELYNFYNNNLITIKLPDKESPQKYAERLYKKNKNRQIEIDFLKGRSQAKAAEIEQLQKLLSELQEIKTNKELKAFLKENPFLSATTKEENQSLFREFTADGFKILVGKNAKNNDLLTQQHTYKEDLWLHAKDVSGSHVVIKYQAGKTVPEQVLEKAAQLAAWYSKRKNDSLCPVLYTPKKYVRKPKGAEPGAVIVEREKVLLVKPENPF